jgi:flagellar basal body rod protein FlgG
MDLLANNLSNSSTSGFKADREFYGTYLAPEIADQPDTVGEAPVVQRQWTDFSQSTISNTGNSTDLALSGTGFFSVNGPNGPLYTRNGNFHLTSEGVLVSGEGYPVRMAGGQTLQVAPGSPIQVGADGQVSQSGTTLGQIELTEFKDPSVLTKAAGAYFANPGPQSGPSPASNVTVQQGALETSNFAPTEAAARMVSLL